MTILLCFAAAAVPSSVRGQHGSVGVPTAYEPAAASLPSSKLQVSSPTSGAGLTVYHMVMGPGDAVWERFGHNAIWIRDRTRGTDVVYNWGMFDFDQPNFLGRFLSGNTRYWMAGFDLPSTIETYAAANRSVWAQELNLAPAQRAELRAFLEWNERPENMYYRYDYYRDNCSTRVRDAIDRVIGGRIHAVTASMPTGTTYRRHTQRLTAGEFPVYTGVTMALGLPADRPISAWDEMFLPMELREHLRGVQVPDESGALAPLVAAETQLFAADRGPEPARPPRLAPVYLAIGVAIAALVLLLSRAVAGGSRLARLGLAVVAAAWGVLTGVLGTGLVLAWTVTRHVFMYENENLFHLDPLALAFAIVAPIALYRAGAGSAARWLAYVIAGVAIVGLALKLLPPFDQQNWEVIALTLPVHAAMAWAVRRATLARRATITRGALEAVA